MGDKIPRTYVYILIVLIVIGAFLAGRSMLAPKADPVVASPSLEERARELEEKDRQIKGLDSQIAQLRKELEESSKKMEDLEARLKETTKTLSSTQQKLKIATRQGERSVTPEQPRDRVASRPVEPAPPSRRSAEAGSYEVIRATSVFEEPSESSRKVATINKGTKVNVVRSVGEWLEVRSKHGNPPGYIRRDDAMFTERRN